MDAKIRDRRRSLNRMRGRRRAGLVIVVVVTFAAIAMFLWLRSSDVFAVRRITATATERISVQEISSIASPAVGDSLLSLSTGSIEEALLSLPYVREAEVHRRFPDTVDIRLVEYEPVACLEIEGGEKWLVAADGRVLEKVDPSVSANLPLVVPTGTVKPVLGEKVSEPIVSALAVATLVKTDSGEKLPTVDRILVSAAGMVVVELKDGPDLRLGDSTDLDHKLMVAVDIIERYLRDGKTIEYIDLVVPDRPAVKAE